MNNDFSKWVENASGLTLDEITTIVSPAPWESLASKDVAKTALARGVITGEALIEGLLTRIKMLTAERDHFKNEFKQASTTRIPADLWGVVDACVSEVTGGEGWVRITLDARSKPAPHLKSLLENKVSLLAAQKGGA